MSGTDPEGVRFRTLDPEFGAVVALDRRVEVLHRGTTWAEGPAFDAATGWVYFSDVPENTLYRWTPSGVTVVRRPSEFANGNTMDADGALITCEQRTRAITRTDREGVRTVLVDHHEGARLNSPNDVIVARDDAIWFSDPDYGIRSAEQGGIAARELAGCYVFRWHEGRTTVMADDLVMPNGLAFSPDESVLYVTDSAYTEDPSAPRHVRAYDYRSGRLSGSRVFAEIDEGWPDGIRVDPAGRVWVAAGDGARCYAPDGRSLGTVLLPEPTANLCFAQLRGEPSLVVTASSTLYRVPLVA